MADFFRYGRQEIEYLKSKDEKMAQLIDGAGMIERRTNPDLYRALADSIIGQQISTAAHNTIRKRVRDKFGVLSAEKVAAISDEELKSIGISWRKVGYIKDFTGKILSGDFDISRLYDMDDEDVIRQLVSLKGVGRWTAEMMLTFSMERPDVLSYGDLAIRRGVMKLYGLQTLTEEQFHRLTDKFSPYRTTAALYFWYYASPSCQLVLP